MKTLLFCLLLVGSAGATEVENIPAPSEGSMPEDAVLTQMETAVAPAVWQTYRAQRGGTFWLFAEERRKAVRHDILPAHWFAADATADKGFHGVAQPGEFYAFQVCVASACATSIAWCVDCAWPVDYVTPRSCHVRANGVKPLWLVVSVPRDGASQGSGCVRVMCGACEKRLPFQLDVRGPVLPDGGVSDAWRCARLKWLNSDIGRERTVTRPFVPMQTDVAARRVTLLGRDVVLGRNGLPCRIRSFFNSSNTRLLAEGCDLLARPLVFEGLSTDFSFTEVAADRVSWQTSTLKGSLDYTGAMTLRMRPDRTDGRFEVVMPADMARYAEGLGLCAQTFPAHYRWQWQVETKNQDAVWCGRVNGGLLMRFRGANYRRPLVNAYYKWGKLALPEGWGAGAGTITLTRTSDVACVVAQGAEVANAEYGVDLYITPFKTIDLKAQFGDRYFHSYGQRPPAEPAAWVAERVRGGATVFNLHHRMLQNPYINYPYSDDGGPYLKRLVDAVHEQHALLKVYYTTRELTQNVPEFFALLSLDGEVVLPRDRTVAGWPVTNPKGPHPWLLEHVGDGIVPSWRENVKYAEFPPRLDLAVLTTPNGRWDNYYLAGLDYLVHRYDIDGIYIDDTALTAEGMRRARRILDRDGRRRLVDNHSWNHHSPFAGGGSSNLVFADLYPYFDRLWRGEEFDENSAPEFWLLEMSGIAYGCMSEMLHNGGNVFRGATLGMTARWGWGGDPRGFWQFVDRVHLESAELIGWWDERCPVRPDNPAVKVSVYRLVDGRSVLAVANWTDQPVATRLGLRGMAEAPAIAGYQTARCVDLSESLALPAKGGVLLVCQ